MTTSKSLPARPSLESLRKQAKKLARDVAAGNAEAVARARAQLPNAELPLSRRDAQLVLAREYGFAGWKDLTEEVLKRTGHGLEWAAAQAERAIHDNDVERLKQLLAEYPALLSWRGGDGDSGLLGMAAGSFGDSFDPIREQTLYACGMCRISDRCRSGGRAIGHRRPHRLSRARAAAAVPTQRPASAHAAVFRGVGRSRWRSCVSRGRQSRSRHASMKRSCVPAASGTRRSHPSCWNAASRSMPSSAGESRAGKAAPPSSSTWSSIHEEFGGPWHDDGHERGHGGDSRRGFPGVRSLAAKGAVAARRSLGGLQVELIELATYNNRGPFIARLLDLDAAVLRRRPPPPSSALAFAFEYGQAHLVPLLTRIWPLPDDLPHAAGMGDFAGVTRWFDAAGQPALGDLSAHHPANHPQWRDHLHWGPPRVQHVLDMALAWACMNRHFEIASFLLEHGADINTDWSTHEPASILHECAVQGNYEAARFLIDRGIDMTRLDYRWNGTAEGWARYAANDQQMADFLAAAAREQLRPSTDLAE